MRYWLLRQSCAVIAQITANSLADAMSASPLAINLHLCCEGVLSRFEEAVGDRGRTWDPVQVHFLTSEV
jgi:hypothetical protein